MINVPCEMSYIGLSGQAVQAGVRTAVAAAGVSGDCLAVVTATLAVL